ncbi:hypothetical protein ACFULT_08210 [Rhodococcus sp. NPDC057297]
MDTLHTGAQQLGVFPHWGIRTYATEVQTARIADDVLDGSSG